MLGENPTRFIIQDEDAIKQDNVINKIFDTTTINNSKSQEALGVDIKANYESISEGKPLKILNTVTGISGKEYELDRHDLLEVLQSLFEEDSAIYKALSGVVNAIDAAEMAALNAMVKVNKVLDRVTGVICNLAALLLGLSLTLPLIRLLDALLGLILLAATKCQYLLYAMIMDAIDSDLLKRLIGIGVVHGALEYNANSLLTQVLNHPTSEGMAENASWLPGLIAGTVDVDYRNKGGKRDAFVPVPYPEWWDDLYSGIGNIDPGYTKGPSGSGATVETSGEYWELDPLVYSPSYIAYARQYRRDISVASVEAEPDVTPIIMSNAHAVLFNDTPDIQTVYS